MRFDGPYKLLKNLDEFDSEIDTIAPEYSEHEIVALWHVCPCGCNAHRRIPVNGHKQENGAGWNYNINENNQVTITPSILDRGTCKAHYFITKGKVQWC